MGPEPPAVGAWSLNNWSTMEDLPFNINWPHPHLKRGDYGKRVDQRAGIFVVILDFHLPQWVVMSTAVTGDLS